MTQLCYYNYPFLKVYICNIIIWRLWSMSVSQKIQQDTWRLHVKRRGQVFARNTTKFWRAHVNSTLCNFPVTYVGVWYVVRKSEDSCTSWRRRLRLYISSDGENLWAFVTRNSCLDNEDWQRARLQIFEFTESSSKVYCAETHIFL